jgi:hypothetical protein
MAFFEAWRPRSLNKEVTHTNGAPINPGWFTELLRFVRGTADWKRTHPDA